MHILPHKYLKMMGIQTWVLRQGQTENPLVDTSPPAVENRDVGNEPQAGLQDAKQKAPNRTKPNRKEPGSLDSETPVQSMGWEALRLSVQNCNKCELHNSRTQTVFGVGDVNARWMIIGEAPGAEDDRLGEPFVGRAGKLLNEMLLAMDLTREQVYIANILKCRPPNNRDPKPEEVQQCEAYLRHQLELIQPKVILTVGRVAAQNLLKTQDKVGQLRNRRFEYAGIPVVVTYHPAYLLRSPKEKRKAWQDLQFAMAVCAEASN